MIDILFTKGKEGSALDLVTRPRTQTLVLVHEVAMALPVIQGPVKGIMYVKGKFWGVLGKGLGRSAVRVRKKPGRPIRLAIPPRHKVLIGRLGLEVLEDPGPLCVDPHPEPLVFGNQILAASQSFTSE